MRFRFGPDASNSMLSSTIIPAAQIFFSATNWQGSIAFCVCGFALLTAPHPFILLLTIYVLVVDSVTETK